MNLQQFFAELDQHDEAVPIDELVALMKRLDITRDDVADRIEFGDECYKRNLLRLGSGYAALVLCWKAGQASPIHDHRGSACGVLVISGQATETQFSQSDDGSLKATQQSTYPQGHVCGSYDRDIHILANDEPNQELITLHVYTPPLQGYRVYTKSGEVRICDDEETLEAMRQREAVA